MTTKITFSARGEFKDSDLWNAARRLRAERGTSARVAVEIKTFACERLIAETWKLHALNPQLTFDQCAARIAKNPAHAHLVYFDRLDPVEPGARDLDAEAERE